MGFYYMLGNLIELCEGSIQALELLKQERLISQEDLERHLEKKLLFIEKHSQTLSL